MDRSNLQAGDNGEHVKELKIMLRMLEYRISDSNGDFDSQTRNAVEAFQNDHGLKVNGVVDPKTWSALEKVCPSISEVADKQ